MAGGSAPAFGFAHHDRLSAPVMSRGHGRAESWTATADDVDAWVKTAQTGEAFVYAHGPQLIQGAASARVTALHEAGEVIPHHKRADDGGFDFIIRRNRVRVVSQRPVICDAPMLAVLLVLQAAAENAERCPSDAIIAGAVDLTADQVKWNLRKLHEARLIERRTVPAPGDARFRVVRIIATGAETRGPQ